jgi:hypothetical protein
MTKVKWNFYITWRTKGNVQNSEHIELRHGAQRQDVQASANWRWCRASRYSGFSELGDGAQRQDVQVSANWETAHSVKKFRFQRTGGRRTEPICSGLNEMGYCAPRQHIHFVANWRTANSVKRVSSVTSVKVTLKLQCGKLNTTALRRMGEWRKIQLQVILILALEVSVSGSRSGYLTPLWKEPDKCQLGRRTASNLWWRKSFCIFKESNPDL